MISFSTSLRHVEPHRLRGTWIDLAANPPRTGGDERARHEEED